MIGLIPKPLAAAEQGLSIAVLALLLERRFASRSIQTDPPVRGSSKGKTDTWYP